MVDINKSNGVAGPVEPTPPSEETPPTPPAPEPPKDEIVTMPKKDFEDMKAAMEEMTKTTNMLLQVADKKSLATFYARNKHKLPTEVNLRMLHGKIIIGWRSIVDEVYLDPQTKKWVENQEVEVLFEDNTVAKMPLMSFYRDYQQVLCRKTGEKTDAQGNIALMLTRLDNGKEYVVGTPYVN